MARACYYCGAPATCDEHVPPKVLLKSCEASRVRRLKVPSCDRHNTAKSDDDNAITKAMLMTLSSMRERWPCTPAVNAAIATAEPHFAQVKGSVKLGSLLKNPPRGFEMPVATLLPHVDVSAWTVQVAAGLAWAAASKRGCENWGHAGVLLPNLIPGQEPRDNADALVLFKRQRALREDLECLPWSPGWWPKPADALRDIFTFDVCGTQAGSLQVVWFRLRFFSIGCYVFFRPTEGVAAAVKEWWDIKEDNGDLQSPD